jgi:hypothetical protein
MQIAALTNLRHLTLSDFEYDSDAFALLSALPSLRRLRLQGGNNLPANLSQLTWLESLTICDDNRMLKGEPEPSAVLLAALPHLTGLTYLALDSMEGVDCPPGELAGLGRLHTFIWLDPSSPPADAVLPAGPWLGSLRHLGAPAGLLANSLALLLEAAPRLVGLVVTVDGKQWKPFPRSNDRYSMRWLSLRKLPRKAVPKIVGKLLEPFLLAARHAHSVRPSLRMDFFTLAPAELWSTGPYV